MKVMIATPSYDGRVHASYTTSLSETAAALFANKIGVEFLIVTQGSLLVAQRNHIIQKFWESDSTHLLCVDSDLGWPEQAVLAMLSFKKEFVCGVYPARAEKNEFLFRPTKGENKSFIQDEKYPHLFQADYIPAGFMLISRSAIEKMRNKYPELYFEPKIKNDPDRDRSGYCFFNTEVYEGEFWGEDFVFCRRAREAGIEIWVDPLIQFDHAGKVGVLIDLLVQESQDKNQNKHNLTLSEAA